jgi:organic hydroperoxide reductase OsmC/OhrA
MAHPHHYRATTVWTGAAHGLRDYDSYSREWRAEIEGKPALRGSADAAFKGDAAFHNPEDLLVVALSTCHMLSYLALCARVGIAVLEYVDEAEGTMAIKDRRMRFTEVILHPGVTIAADADLARAEALHEQAHAECFVANSVNFPVTHRATVTRATTKAKAV